MTNRHAARSPKQRAAMRTTTGAAVPAQQGPRPKDATYQPGELPDDAPKPYYNYERREWVFPPLPEKYGRPRDIFRAWEDDDGV